VNASNSRDAAAPQWQLWLLLSASVIAADQVSKAVVLATLHPGETRAITQFFNLVLTFNAGAAFSFLGDASGWQRYLFSAFAVGAAAVIVWLLRRGGNRLYCAGLSLILGGALGNLWDRATIGGVVDFLQFHDYLPFRHAWLAWLDPFPAFNVADSAISVGAALLIIDALRPRTFPSAEAS